MRYTLFITLALLLQVTGHGQSISRIEYFFDTDPGYGVAAPVSFSSGPSVTASFTVSTAGLSTGIHHLLIRAKNSGGQWSTVTGTPVFVSNAVQSVPVVTLEYYIDSDPGFGSATQVPVTSGLQVPAFFQLNTTGLADGMHHLCIRAKDASDRWSILSEAMFVVEKASSGFDITRIEYFTDTDPGFGNAVQAVFTPGKQVSVTFSPDFTNLTDGVHFLCVRARNSTGTWSTLRQFVFSRLPDAKSRITRMEYFTGTDPGFGNGHPVSIVPSYSPVIQFSPDTAGLAPGMYQLMVRVSDSAGNWSIIHDTAFNYSSTPKMWTGVLSDDWNLAGNWNPSGVPGWNDDVTIPAVAPNMPFIRNQGLSCRKVSVTPGGALHVQPGIVLTVNGDLRLE